MFWKRQTSMFGQIHPTHLDYSLHYLHFRRKQNLVLALLTKVQRFLLEMLFVGWHILIFLSIEQQDLHQFRRRHRHHDDI